VDPRQNSILGKGSGKGSSLDVFCQIGCKRIVFEQIQINGGDPSSCEIVSSDLNKGIWYVLVDTEPGYPGSGTIYKVSEKERAVVGDIPGF